MSTCVQCVCIYIYMVLRVGGGLARRRGALTIILTIITIITIITIVITIVVTIVITTTITINYYHYYHHYYLNVYHIKAGPARRRRTGATIWGRPAGREPPAG